MRASNLTIVALVLASSSATAVVPQEGLERARGATVLVKVERYFHDRHLSASGAGLFVDDRGHVLTAWRLVAPEFVMRTDGRDTEVVTTVGSVAVVVASGQPDEQTLPARVLRLDRARELALLEVAFGSPTFLAVSAAAQVAPREAVLLLGYPTAELGAVRGRNPAVTETAGTVISIRRNAAGGGELVELAADLSPSGCGGPVLDGHGDVVGVVASARGGPGMALAVAPDELRGFRDEAQFDVRLTPPWISTSGGPLLLEVRPLLRNVGGLSGRATLAAGAVEVARRDLTARLGSLTAQLLLPALAAEPRVPAVFTLSLQLSDAAGRPVFRHDWTIPVQVKGAAEQASERVAANLSPSRGGPANQPSARNGAVMPSQPAPLPGNERNRDKPLSRLASGVKLADAGESTGLVVKNSNLGGVAFVVVESHYAALPPELREIAIQFDRAEFGLGSLTVGVTYGSGSMASEAPGGDAGGPFAVRPIGKAQAAAAATVSQGVADTGGPAPSASGGAGGAGSGARGGGGGYAGGLGQQISNARASVDAAHAKVLQAGICRCPDHTWFRGVDRGRCERCTTP